MIPDACDAQCRGRMVAWSKEWAGWPGKERRGEDFCTDDQKTAKENALLEISVSSLYAGLLVEKVYTITWENCNSIKWVPIFEISTRMVNLKGKNCIGSKGQRKRWWRGKRQTYYMPATNVEASYRSVGRHNLNEHLERKSLLPEEQKECRRNLRGTKDQLLIDRMILKNCRRRKTGLGMVWLDYKKAYDLIPHSWIIECMNMFGVAENVAGVIQTSMKQWNTELTAGNQFIGPEVCIKRGIFQGDSLSPLLFVLALMLLTLVLRKVKAGYNLENGLPTINHLLFMDDLKLYGKAKTRLIHCYSLSK